MKSERQTVVTIFGITGDWAYKKVIPSIFHLWRSNVLENNFKVIGLGRRQLSKLQLKKIITKAVKAFLKSGNVKIQAKDLKMFTSKFEYVQNDFNALKKIIPEESNKIFYCATPPSALEGIFKSLKNSGLSTQHKNTWSRIVIEKPFGESEKSARQLISCLKENFATNQVFPIDHYLFKKSVQKIKSLNKEDAKKIARVEIITNETDGVEKRGKFYDSLGAFLDVGQNHLLMLLAILFSGKGRSKFAVLKSLAKWNEKSLQENTFRAQHKGYTKIKDVMSDSKKETFFKIKTWLNMPMWRNVSINLQSGKKLKETRKEVVISFRNRNRKKIIKIQNKIKYVEEYAKALQDVILGSKKYFVTYEEILACWRFTDPIINFWKKNGSVLNTYKPGATPQANI